jgi:hypothetical protein
VVGAGAAVGVAAGVGSTGTTAGVRPGEGADDVAGPLGGTGAAGWRHASTATPAVIRTTAAAVLATMAARWRTVRGRPRRRMTSDDCQFIFAVSR